MRVERLCMDRPGVTGQRVLPFAAILLLAASLALANGFRNPPPGAAGLALDGGKIAHIDDASAATINPANLVDVKRGVLLSATYIDGKTDLATPLGGVSTRNNQKLMPNIFGVMPLSDDGGLVAGLGLTVPYGQSVEWPRGGSVANYHTEMLTLNLAPSLATRVGDAVSIAVGVDIYYSDLELKSTTAGSSQVPDGTVVSLTGDGVGVGANAAITWRMTENQRLACTYRAPFSVEYEGDVKMSVPAPQDDFETEIDFPSMVVLGYGIQVTDTVRLGADVEWIEFSRNEALQMDYGIYNLSPDFAALRVVPQDWDDIWTAGMAGSWNVTEDWTLRASYKYMESPIPDSTLSPTLPDADKHALAVGAGWHGENDALDVAYMYSILDDRDVVTGGVPLSYDMTSHIVGINYRRQF